MSSKAAILQRIREALSVPSLRPAGHGEGPAVADGEGREFGRWLPVVGGSLEEQIALFARNSAELRTEFHVLESRAELPGRIVALAAEAGWGSVASHGGELADLARSALALPVLLTDAGYDKEGLEQCAAGISECDALVAQTGSVLITSRSAGGRALSVLPPHHVVVASRGQMVAGLPEAYALLGRRYGACWPSLISFITGPSRTGDIERILVLGAHGPKRLTVFLT